jgi:hypothetical protein
LTRQRPGARTIQEDTDLVVAEHVGAVGG